MVLLVKNIISNFMNLLFVIFYPYFISFRFHILNFD